MSLVWKTSDNSEYPFVVVILLKRGHEDSYYLFEESSPHSGMVRQSLAMALAGSFNSVLGVHGGVHR